MFKLGCFLSDFILLSFIYMFILFIFTFNECNELILNKIRKKLSYINIDIRILFEPHECKGRQLSNLFGALVGNSYNVDSLILVAIFYSLCVHRSICTVYVVKPSIFAT